jgi:hypothetical protein
MKNVSMTAVVGLLACVAVLVAGCLHLGGGITQEPDFTGRGGPPVAAWWVARGSQSRHAPRRVSFLMCLVRGRLWSCWA